MAISTNGGSNPTSVTYNGKNVTEVWYKSSWSATSVKVWPDTPTPTPTGKAYLTQNRWPKAYTSGSKFNAIDRDPRWTPIKIVSTENPNSMYFEGPQEVPFTCKFWPQIELSNYPLQYWTLEKPDGTVLRFDDLDAHTITIDQAGEWKENSYWKESSTPTPTPTVDPGKNNVILGSEYGDSSVQLLFYNNNKIIKNMSSMVYTPLSTGFGINNKNVQKIMCNLWVDEVVVNYQTYYGKQYADYEKYVTFLDYDSTSWRVYWAKGDGTKIAYRQAIGISPSKNLKIDIYRDWGTSGFPSYKTIMKISVIE